MKFQTHFVEKMHRTGDIWSFRFERPPEYVFEAGQWGMVDIRQEEEVLGHHFTHSSSPTAPYLELTTRVRDSTFKRVLAELSPGTEVDMEGPFGSFKLPEEDLPLVFLTGGIGITPVLSILRFLADGGEDRDLTLFFGNTDQEGIPFRDELTMLEAALPRTHVVHVLSRPTDDWPGLHGHLTGEMIATKLGTLGGRRYFISGPPGLVLSLEGVLYEGSVPKDAIIKEDFEGY